MARSMTTADPIEVSESSIAALAERMGYVFDELPPAKRGALGLLWAGLRLARRADNAAHCLPLLVDYGRALSPNLNETRVRALMDRVDGENLEALRDVWSSQEVQKAFPKPLLIAGLVQLVPPGHPNMAPLWDFIDEVAGELQMDGEFASYFHNWRTQAADESVNARVESVQKSWADKNQVTEEICANLEPVITGDEVNVLSLREEVQEGLKELEPHLDELNVAGAQKNRLEDYLATDKFRLAVMGEFKRGKSTFINALLEEPGLMPTATLPCTSELTEIQAGDERSYAVSEKRGYPGTFEEKSSDEFDERVAQAASTSHSEAEAEEVAEQIRHWRVTIPSGFLAETSISVVDSPGLGEDHGRDKVVTQEAKRADAAVLIFDAKQLASLEEMELIESMNTKAKDLFIVINKSDLIDDDERPELREHVLEEIASITSVPFDDRIFFLSAKEAEDAIEENRGSEYLEEFREFRDSLRSRLIERAGQVKAERLKQKTASFIEDVRESIDHELETRRELLQRHGELKAAKERADRELQNAEQSIEHGVEILSQSGEAKKELTDAFDEALPGLLDELDSRSENWTSDKNPTLSPKKFATEISEQAQEELIGIIEVWLGSSGANVVSEEIEQKLTSAIDKLQPLKAYLEDAAGRDLGDFRNRIRTRSFEKAFGADNLVSPGEVIGHGAVVGAVSAVVGYIIADFVLYYMLGVISGFLNPVLLVGAAGIGSVAALMGQDGLRDRIKNKVVEKISAKLDSSEVRQKLHEALGEGVETVFEQLSRGFKESAQELLMEAQVQRDRTLRELEQFKEEIGNSPKARDEELQRIEVVAEEAEEQLDKLESLVD
jgi:ribosome biogenesis GTPase A